jgi:hypothetical protein
MGVVNLPGGRPTMKLTGGALARLESLLPPGHEARIDLTITDDWPLAQALSSFQPSRPPRLDPLGGQRVRTVQKSKIHWTVRPLASFHEGVDCTPATTV